MNINLILNDICITKMGMKTFVENYIEGGIHMSVQNRITAQFYGCASLGRRVKKTVYVYEASAFSLQDTYMFVYDGWNLIEELDDSQSVQKAYVWGLDLSRSLQSAGGVGGLIAAVDDSVTYLYSYDGNGNVGQVIDVADGSVVAHYEYDPYGNLVNKNGDYADENVCSGQQKTDTKLSHF